MVNNFRGLKNGYGNEVPPEIEYVYIYFLEKGFAKEHALCFFEHYQQKCWLNPTGKLILDWKRCAWQWIWNKPPIKTKNEHRH